MKILTAVMLSFVFVAVGFGQDGISIFGSPESDPPGKTTLRARVFYEDTGRAVRRANVVLLPDNEDNDGGPQMIGQEASGMTDDQGNLVINNLRAGRYMAMVNLPGVLTPLAYLNISERRPSLGKVREQFRPIVVDGVTEAFADIPVRRGGAISGRVMYSDGDAASGVRIEILRKTDGELSQPLTNLSSIMSMFIGGGGLTTDDRGVFRVNGLPEGEYVVKVVQNAKHTEPSGRREMAMIQSMMGFGVSMISTFFDNAADENSATVLNLSLGQEIGDVNIMLPERSYHNLAGKVVASHDKLPIGNVSVKFERVGDTGNTLQKAVAAEMSSLATGDDGSFEIKDLPAGKYIVTLVPGETELDQAKRAYVSKGGSDAMEMAAAAAVSAAANTSAPGPPRPPRPRSGASSQPKPEPPRFAGRKMEIEISDRDLIGQVIELDLGSTVTGTVETADRKELPGSISISIADESGDLVSNTTVSSFNFEFDGEGNPLPSRPQSPQKEFKIRGIASGRKLMSVVPSDNKYYVRSASAAGRDLASGMFDLRQGDTISGVRIVLANDTGEVKGKVIDGDGEPMASFRFSLVPTDAARAFNTGLIRSAMTDAQGEFSVDMPPFEYAIVFGDLKKARATPESRAAFIESLRDAQKVSVDAKGSTKITVKYERPATR